MKYKYIIFVLFCFLISIFEVKAENLCTVEAAQQLAKILYKEVGIDCAVDSSENFFMKLTTANVVLNNAYNKSGNSLYEKMINLTDNNYQAYSTYKNSSFSSVVPQSKQGEMLYIAQLILNGKYSIPSNIVLQASDSIVNTYGTVWASVKTTSGFYDVYFGYTGSSLSNKNIFGNTLSHTDSNYYKNLATSLKKGSYSSYTSSNVCSGSTVSNDNNNSTPSNNNSNNSNNQNIKNYDDVNLSKNTKLSDDKTTFECTSDDQSILGNPKKVGSVAYYLQTILDIIKYIAIVLCIVLTIYDFSKALFSEDKDIVSPLVKKAFTRLIFTILLFFLPIIVKALLSLIGVYSTCSII